MCGRLNTKLSPALWAQALESLGVYQIPDPPTDRNATPSSVLPIVAEAGERRKLFSAYWGFLPGSKYSTINARAESLEEKPLYRKAFHERRGIIIADSFYEWDKSIQPSQPYRVLRSDGLPIYLAALFTYRKDEPKISCTIVTTASAGFMSQIHNRMPVVLDLPEADAWLDPETTTPLLHKMISPHEWRDMTMYHISTLVNSPKNKGDEILQPV